MNRKSQKEIQVTTHMVRQFLQENEDTGYRDFHSNLLPGVDNVMGIRLPVLRKFAKQLSGMDWNGLNRRMTSGMKKRCFTDW